MISNPNETAEQTVITVRGVDHNFYDQVCLEATKSGKNVGEIVNEAFSMYLHEIGLERRTVGNGLGTLTLTKADLESLGKVTITSVGLLTFGDDVDVETLNNNVDLIQNCGTVSVPKNTYIEVLSKVKNCGKVVDSSIVQVRGIEDLELSKEDIRSIGKKVIIREIENLKILPDVDKETVENYILEIRDVDNLEVPSSIFGYILARTRDCEEVSSYSS